MGAKILGPTDSAGTDRDGPDVQRQLERWALQLVDKTYRLAIPTDFPRQARRSGDRVGDRLAIPSRLYQALLGLAGEPGRLVSLLAAGLVTLLYRWSGPSELIFGWFAPREEVQQPDDILLIRTDVRGEPRFFEVWQRLNAQMQEAFEQKLSWSALERVLGQRFQSAQLPRPQVLFGFHPPMWQQVAASSFVPLGKGEIEDPVASCDPCMLLETYSQSVGGELHGPADLFQPSTIVRMSRQYLKILGRAASDPYQSLSRFNVD